MALRLVEAKAARQALDGRSHRSNHRAFSGTREVRYEPSVGREDLEHHLTAHAERLEGAADDRERAVCRDPFVERYRGPLLLAEKREKPFGRERMITGQLRASVEVNAVHGGAKVDAERVHDLRIRFIGNPLVRRIDREVMLGNVDSQSDPQSG